MTGEEVSSLPTHRQIN